MTQVPLFFKARFFPRKYLLYAPPLILEYNIIELVAPAFAFFNSSSSHFDSFTMIYVLSMVPYQVKVHLVVANLL